MSLRSTWRWPRGLAVLLALVFVVANVVYNHAEPPLGLLGSPLVAALACALALVGAAAWSPYGKAGLCAGLLMVQDLGLKLYGGGHDDLGWQATCNLLLVVAAVLSLGGLAIGLWRSRQQSALHKLAAGGLFVTILAGHLLLLASLGMGHSIGLYLD